MSRLEIGTEVRIKELSCGNCYSLFCSREMVKYSGKTAKILDERGNYYILDVDCGYWFWSNDMFDVIPEYFEAQGYPLFCIGEVVKIKNFCREDRSVPFHFAEKMLKYAGKCATIVKAEYSKKYKVYIYYLNFSNDTSWYNFSYPMFERTLNRAPIKPTIEECKPAINGNLHEETRMINCKQTIVLVDRCGDVAKAVSYNCGVYTYETSRAGATSRQFYPRFI